MTRLSLSSLSPLSLSSLSLAVVMCLVPAFQCLQARVLVVLALENVLVLAARAARQEHDE